MCIEIPEYTWYAVPSGTLTFVNEAYADYLGLAKDDPLRLGLETVCRGTPTSNWCIPTTAKRRLESGQPVTELGLPAKRPSEYETLKENSAGSLIGINLDIEELKRAEEQRRIAEETIREQEIDLRHILDRTPQLIAFRTPGATLINGRYGQATNFRRSSLGLTANKEKTCDPRRNRIFDVAEGHHER